MRATLAAGGRRQAGLTLVELMIAMVISLVLMAAIASVYVSARGTSRANDGWARLQENVRVAFDLMTLDIRQSAYRGCGGKAGAFINTLKTSVAPTSLWQFDKPLRGYEATGASWSPAVPDAASVVPSASAGSDILMVRVVTDGGGVITEHGLKTDSPKIPLGSQVAQGDIVIATNCQAASVFQVTSTAAGNDASGTSRTVVGHVINSGTPGNSTTNLERAYENGELRRLDTKFYYIRDSGSSPGVPALYVGSAKDLNAAGVIPGMELVTGVESMQIEYGVLAADGSLASYKKADAMADPADWDNVGSIRVTLVLVSERKNLAVTSAATSASSSSASSASANAMRLRQQFTTTISIRNLAN